MPQLRDGSPAHVGIRVIGKPGALPYEVTGVLISVLEESEGYNVQVAFADLLPLGGFGQGAMMVGIRNEWGRAEDFGPLEQAYVTARRLEDGRVERVYREADGCIVRTRTQEAQ